MPTIKERFSKIDTSKEDMDDLVVLRKQMGAVSSAYHVEGNEWVLESEFEVSQ